MDTLISALQRAAKEARSAAIEEDGLERTRLTLFADMLQGEVNYLKRRAA